MAKINKSKTNKEYIDKRHKVLQDIYRHYIDFQDYYMRTGQHVIEAHGLTISFLDLKTGLDKLAPRKREAFLYNIIYDMKQDDVAKIMGIRPVTAGQYSSSASEQLSKYYFAELTESPAFKEDTSRTEEVEDLDGMA